MATRRVHVFVSGRVQGVFFRESTRRRASRLGLRGYVRNLADGRVEAVFEGEADAVASALAFVAEGPPGASVTAVETRDEAISGPRGAETGFRIL